MKKIFTLILIIFIYGCGYTSVYKNQKNQNLKINIIEMTGDFETNNFIENQLKLASNSSSSNNFDISYITTFEKTIISKNSSGLATNYRLSMNAKFIILSKGNKKIEFNETFNIKNNSENFEQSNYEREIKKNFAISIKDKLVFNLLISDDS